MGYAQSTITGAAYERINSTRYEVHENYGGQSTGTLVHGGGTISGTMASNDINSESVGLIIRSGSTNVYSTGASGTAMSINNYHNFSTTLAAGTYTIIFVGAYEGFGGVSLSNYLQINFPASAQAAVTISPTTQTVTVGSSITFTAAGGSGTGAYTWGGDGTGTGTTKAVTFNTVGTRTATEPLALASMSLIQPLQLSR